MNLRIIFKFKDFKLQLYEKRRLFSYFSVNPLTPARRWRRVLKLKRKKINSFKIIIGFFFTPPLLFRGPRSKFSSGGGAKEECVKENFFVKLFFV